MSDIMTSNVYNFPTGEKVYSANEIDNIVQGLSERIDTAQTSADFARIPRKRELDYVLPTVPSGTSQVPTTLELNLAKEDIFIVSVGNNVSDYYGIIEFVSKNDDLSNFPLENGIMKTIIITKPANLSQKGAVRFTASGLLKLTSTKRVVDVLDNVSLNFDIRQDHISTASTTEVLYQVFELRNRNGTLLVNQIVNPDESIDVDKWLDTNAFTYTANAVNRTVGNYVPKTIDDEITGDEKQTQSGDMIPFAVNITGDEKTIYEEMNERSPIETASSRPQYFNRNYLIGEGDPLTSLVLTLVTLDHDITNNTSISVSLKGQLTNQTTSFVSKTFNIELLGIIRRDNTISDRTVLIFDSIKSNGYLTEYIIELIDPRTIKLSLKMKDAHELSFTSSIEVLAQEIITIQGELEYTILNQNLVASLDAIAIDPFVGSIVKGVDADLEGKIGYKDISTTTTGIAFGSSVCLGDAPPLDNGAVNLLGLGNFINASNGENSTAIGHFSEVKNYNNSVALGYGSVVAANDEVSVGTESSPRRITNISKGVNPSDALILDQLDAKTEFHEQSNDNIELADRTHILVDYELPLEPSLIVNTMNTTRRFYRMMINKNIPDRFIFPSSFMLKGIDNDSFAVGEDMTGVIFLEFFNVSPTAFSNHYYVTNYLEFLVPYTPEAPTQGITYIDNGDGTASVGDNSLFNGNSVVIASAYNTLPVIGISANAFTGTAIERVVIPSNITTIGDYAFSQCSNLSEAIISKNITTIGTGAFSSCNSLKDIKVEITNPNYMSSLGSLYSKDGSEMIQYPNGKLDTHFIIPDNVTVIAEGAFLDNNKLVNVELTENVTTIKSDGFRNCTSLLDLHIPTNVETIEGEAFYGCTALEITTDFTEKPAGWANNFNPNNRPVIYTEKVESVVYIDNGDGTASVGDNTGYTGSIPVLSSEYEGLPVTSISASAFKGTEITSITIPSSITTVGTEAFSNCDKLTGIIIPQGITTIGSQAFSKCNVLRNITVNGANANYTSVDGILYSKDLSTLIQYPNGLSVTLFSIPNTTNTIGEYAFSENRIINSISVPSSVTTIKQNAFEKTNISSITLPATIETMESNVFLDSNLITITSQAATQPSTWATDWNPSNRPVVFQGAPTDPLLNTFAFDLTNGDAEYAVKAKDTTISGEIEVPQEYSSKPVTSIASAGFKDCVNITKVTIPEGVTVINTEAFNNCTSLDEITIPDTMTTIEENSFN